MEWEFVAPLPHPYTPPTRVMPYDLDGNQQHGGSHLFNNDTKCSFTYPRKDSIKAGFQNPAFGTIDDLAAGLKSGSIKSGGIEPIRLVERQDNFISIDNRRLEAFRRAGMNVPTRMATPAEIQQAVQQGKFSAGEQGGTTIRVRGQ